MTVNRLAARYGPVLIACTFILLTITSWRAWPDPLIDFGRELYTAWRLASGDVLYRDVAWFNGPLSPYVNAAWMSIAGDSLLVIAVANLLVAALVTALIWHLVSSVANRTTATAACVLFVTVFAFGQFLRIGNYNYVCPYAHEMTHGLLLALLAITALGRFARRGDLRFAAAAGLCVGLVFLTKPELFLAAAAASGVGLAGVMRMRGDAARTLTVFGLAMLTPVLVAWALLATAMPSAAAVRATLGGWPAVLDGEAASLPFYRKRLGVDDVGESFWRMLMWTLALAVALAGPLIISTLTPATPRRRAAVATVVFSVLFVTLLALDVTWADATRSLPVILAAAACIQLTRFVRRTGRRDAEVPDETSARILLGLMLLVFAVTLAAKMGLALQPIHYGFVLAMPATLAGLVLGLHALPRWMDGRGPQGVVVAAAVAAMFAAMTISLTTVSVRNYIGRTFRIGTGADTLLAPDDKRSRSFQAVLDRLSEADASEQTLAVLPEGAMINFMLRRPNSTPYASVMPLEMLLFGESEMLAAFMSDPPDRIVISRRSTWEYGMASFGMGYGETLAEWLSRNYEAEQQFGSFWIIRRRDDP